MTGMGEQIAPASRSGARHGRAPWSRRRQWTVGWRAAPAGDRWRLRLALVVAVVPAVVLALAAGNAGAQPVAAGIVAEPTGDVTLGAAIDLALRANPEVAAAQRGLGITDGLRRRIMPRAAGAIPPPMPKCWRSARRRARWAASGWTDASFGSRWSRARCAPGPSPMPASRASITRRPTPRAARWSMARACSISRNACTGPKFIPASARRRRENCCAGSSARGGRGPDPPPLRLSGQELYNPRQILSGCESVGPRLRRSQSFGMNLRS